MSSPSGVRTGVGGRMEEGEAAGGAGEGVRPFGCCGVAVCGVTRPACTMIVP